MSQGGGASLGGGTLYIQAHGTGGSINIDTPTLRINNNVFRYVPSTTYTPFMPSGSCPYRRGSYSITGSMMTVHITLSTVGGAGTAGIGIYGFGIPDGYTIKIVPFNSVPTNGEVQQYINTGVAGDYSKGLLRHNNWQWMHTKNGGHIWQRRALFLLLIRY